MGRDVTAQVKFSSLECLELQMFQILGFGMAAYTYISCVRVCACLHVYVGCAHMCTCVYKPEVDIVCHSLPKV